MLKRVVYSQEADLRQEAGFSLVEMLIALVVTLFGLVSIVGFAVYVSRANSISNNINILATVAQDQVDRLRTAVWSATSESPMVTLGGELYSPPGVVETEGDGVQTSAVTSMQTSPTNPSPSTGEQVFYYQLDSTNPHRATVSNTPAGDLIVTWKVAATTTPDLRRVTIKVVALNALPGIADGFVVSTMLIRN